MKASELIQILEQKIKEVGDKDVTLIDPEYGDTDNVQSVIYQGGEIVIL